MDAFRAGIDAGAVPWRWWTARVPGPYDPAGTRAHLYRVAWQEPHEPPAKCGYAPPEGAEWAAEGPEPAAPCRRCTGEQGRQGSGSIGGVDVATREVA